MLSSLLQRVRISPSLIPVPSHIGLIFNRDRWFEGPSGQSNSLIIVTGCYPQVEPEAFLKMKGVRYLLGNREKKEIPDLLPLMQKGKFPRVQVGDIQKEILFSETPIYSFHHHTRAFLKIQDGCNAHCSYCIVPHARGRSRSLPPERVIENLKDLQEKGFKEVVLTGIHLGAYGQDLDSSFSLDQTGWTTREREDTDRIRLSSIEPEFLSRTYLRSHNQVKYAPPSYLYPERRG
jgi:threonylcarbamoyladenosine tRNA methylthiotransferase MtaB